MLRRFCTVVGIDPARLSRGIGRWSIEKAIQSSDHQSMVENLRSIVPDISGQYTFGTDHVDSYMETKLRGMHAFQCALMLNALGSCQGTKRTVVDIGDSAGTHMMYLKALAKSSTEITTLSVNLDPAAVEKIRARGLDAVLCRAEELPLLGITGDLFVSFEMLEHLHNPALFLRRLAKQTECRLLVVTVPFRRNSRVGLHTIRNDIREAVTAEGEHIFELNPSDWKLLMLHSGWRVVQEETYYQYPTAWPVANTLLSWYWRTIDFEGFWGAILQKDVSVCDRYLDWEDKA